MDYPGMMGYWVIGKNLPGTKFYTCLQQNENSFTMNLGSLRSQLE